MGMCSGKCIHHSPNGSGREMLTCCVRKLKVIQGLGDNIDSSKLLTADADTLFDDKHVICGDDKSEELFGYSIISQESSRGGSRQTTPKTSDMKFDDAAGDVSMRTSYPDPKYDSSGYGDKVVFLLPQPTPSELSMYIVTWNMNGKALVRSIAKLLDVDGERHDLYVIGLQEAHNSVAESVISEALGEKYSFVAAASMQSLQLFIIARKAILTFLSKPLVDKISTGCLGGLAGRQKGAVAVTLKFKGASLLFIASHFAAHRSNVGERNAQYHHISQSVFNRQAAVVGLPRGVFSGCSHVNGVVDDSVLGPEHPPTDSNFAEKADVVVWMGDLNYRVEMNRSAVAFLIGHKFEEMLWSKDQLIRVLRKGQAFVGYQEGPLSFRPTYKYDVGTDNYDTSCKERVPSWTDRILYKVREEGKLKVRLKNYNCINSIKSSDHKPVKAVMTLSLNNSPHKKSKIPFISSVVVNHQ